ncbi:hypothetical protein FIBSPDRAFT_183756 [Athelia psychrophila]|uniref:Uncharacterized protein n=1 Tax=Athelia psychrophila TaxID=1759441 RepID=A0A166AEL3_9AGAM|nr:hypothetical protein FIBSPDRAFT_183756 [Fibularhizoctonia sp. CBS 109695]
MRMTTRKITNKGPEATQRSYQRHCRLTFGIERGVLHEVAGLFSKLSPPELHELRDVLHPSNSSPSSSRMTCPATLTNVNITTRFRAQGAPAASIFTQRVRYPLPSPASDHIKCPSYIVLSSARCISLSSEGYFTARRAKGSPSQALLARNTVANLLLPTNTVRSPRTRTSSFLAGTHLRRVLLREMGVFTNPSRASC